MKLSGLKSQFASYKANKSWYNRLLSTEPLQIEHAEAYFATLNPQASDEETDVLFSDMVKGSALFTEEYLNSNLTHAVLFRNWCNKDIKITLVDFTFTIQKITLPPLPLDLAKYYPSRAEPALSQHNNAAIVSTFLISRPKISLADLHFSSLKQYEILANSSSSALMDAQLTNVPQLQS